MRESAEAMPIRKDEKQAAAQEKGRQSREKRRYDLSMSRLARDVAISAVAADSAETQSIVVNNAVTAGDLLTSRLPRKERRRVLDGLVKAVGRVDPKTISGELRQQVEDSQSLARYKSAVADIHKEDARKARAVQMDLEDDLSDMETGLVEVAKGINDNFNQTVQSSVLRRREYRLLDEQRSAAISAVEALWLKSTQPAGNQTTEKAQVEILPDAPTRQMSVEEMESWYGKAAVAGPHSPIDGVSLDQDGINAAENIIKINRAE